MKIVFVGAGNMAAALIGGLLGRGTVAADLYAIDPDADARARIAAQFGVDTAATTEASAQALQSFHACDAIVLAVKPQVARDVAQALAPHLDARQLVISIAAGIRAADLSRWLGGHARCVRAMPNTPALIGQGITGLAALASVDAHARELATRIVGAVGDSVWVDDEAAIDAVTAISGSGPAYVFYFIEALEEAARRLGMDPQQGRALAVATFTGAARLAAHSAEPVALLRERVTSKGGTTAAALAAFDAAGVKEAIVQGALAADARAKEMGDALGRP